MRNATTLPEKQGERRNDPSLVCYIYEKCEHTIPKITVSQTTQTSRDLKININMNYKITSVLSRGDAKVNPGRGQSHEI
jgi:hypothetical protein